MSAYTIVNIDVIDQPAFRQYQAQFPALVERFGGRYLVRGGHAENWEGEWDPKRLIVIEFPTLDHLCRLAASPEYQAVKAIRDRATHTDFVVVEGV